MPNPRLTQVIADLPFEKKIVGIGALLMIVGLFFPWYQDLDTFRTGDSFSGLSGPMYFVGFTFLVMAAGSLAVMMMDHLDKKIPLLKMKSSRLHLFCGIASMYLLFLEGSVYFHPAFGVNITLKQSGIGMFMGFAAAALLVVGGYLEGRGKAAVKEFEKETRDEVDEVIKPIAELRKPRENLRAMSSVPSVTAAENQPTTPTHEPVSHSAQPQSAQDERPAQPYRMDL